MQYTLEEIKEGVSQLENVSFVKRRLAVPEKLYYSTLIWRLKFQELEESHLIFNNLNMGMRYSFFL